MTSSSPSRRMVVVTLLAGAALFAALWMLALAPKRSESVKVRASLATSERRLSTVRAGLASYRTSYKQFPGMLAELRRLDEAVPARRAIPSLLRQLQRRARAQQSDLRLVELKSAAATPGSGVAPGAAVGPGGLATLPFSFTYTGAYFDLVHVLGAARRSVTVKAGDLTIEGRLVTIEGMSFKRAAVDSPLIEASVSATAYIAAEKATPPATPASLAAASPQGGS